MLGRSAERTFYVDGHHYALVCLADLEPGSCHEYEVELDGEPPGPSPAATFLPASCAP